MFVSVVCELATEDHEVYISDLLLQYGFKKIMAQLFESTTIIEKDLLRLKRDIDRHTDAYDKVRFYQYPMEETMVITVLHDKKWRKIIVRP